MRRLLTRISHPLTVFGVAASLLTGTQWALGCACCSSAGQRSVLVTKFDAGKREEINKLRFGPVAQLFLGAADPGIVKGIVAPTERYDLGVTLGKDRLAFAFRDQAGHAGTLTLAAPNTISMFEVDTRDEPDRPQGPSLYKEWKLTSMVGATGIFAPSAGAGQRIMLIVQGRGNSCTGSGDFSHWTLVVAGPKANYSFFGDLVR